MDKFSFFLFGVTGNLTQIKVIPAIYDLFEKKRIPEDTPIIGLARKGMTTEEFRTYVHDILLLPNRHHQHPIDEKVWQTMAKNLSYIQGDFSDEQVYEQIQSVVHTFSPANVVYYLATYPQLYQTIFEQLKKKGLTDQQDGWKRLMIEKPIGIDLPSSQNLNYLINEYFEEAQVYRLDHYLGKITLQNILTFRFGNGFLEPLFSKEHVDHIQITSTEDYGIGRRGQYFDSVGMLKDVGQNHSLQMLTLATMDAPSEFSNEAVTKERVKILQQLVPEPDHIVFGQYQGYTGEEFVLPNSQADTFFALRTHLTAPRWKNVPIYIRAGKMLKQTFTEVSIVFKTPKNRLFKHLEGGLEPNVLTFRIQPNDGIVLQFLSRKPGPDVLLERQFMQFCYKHTGNEMPDAYENLIADVIEGDQTFFNDAIEVESQWAFTDPLSAVKTRPIPYPQDSWGPTESFELLRRDGREWLEPSLAVCAM